MGVEDNEVDLAVDGLQLQTQSAARAMPEEVNTSSVHNKICGQLGEGSWL
jgi:hypothetical protein